MTKALRTIRIKRSQVRGSLGRPRIVIDKSNRHLRAQLIDDVSGKTLVAVNDKQVEVQEKSKLAFALGQLLAQEAAKNKITQAVFDRRGHTYHGIVAQVAQGARDKGLTI